MARGTYNDHNNDDSNDHGYDVVVAGAGFAGLYMLYKARKQGLRTIVLEAAGGIGGTWYWNRYPGARCDVESVEYSYSFSEELQQEWEWTERYASQPEILRYLEHVAERFDLYRDIRLDTKVEAAHFDDRTGRWSVTTESGQTFVARFFITATGCLSSANVPTIPGLADFEGEIYHTARWPHHAVDFSGKRVGVIGTGSSGVQLIPEVAEQAESLVVFQRTANYAAPAHNGPLDPAEQAEIKADYPRFRDRNRRTWGAFGSRTPLNNVSALDVSGEELFAELQRRWDLGGFGILASFNDLALNEEANDLAADFFRAKIRETVDDPDVADVLMPRTRLGCKRLCLDSGYFETFNRPDVRLVDISETPITEITAAGVRVGGDHHELDCLVFATGFDAMTGSLMRIDIRGRGGLSLRDRWAAGPTTYLGLGISGFPNLFNIAGPGSPSVLANMVMAIEHHVDWIAACIAHLDAQGHATIEATPDAEAAWVEHVNHVASHYFYSTCNSWYVGANIPGKPRVFMPLPGFPPYVKKCAEVAANDYEGFIIGRAPLSQ